MLSSKYSVSAQKLQLIQIEKDFTKKQQETQKVLSVKKKWSSHQSINLDKNMEELEEISRFHDNYFYNGNSGLAKFRLIDTSKYWAKQTQSSAGSIMKQIFDTKVQKYPQ